MTVHTHSLPMPAEPRPSLLSALAVAATTFGADGPRGRRADLTRVPRQTVAHTACGPLSVLRAGVARRSLARLVLVHGTPGSAASWGPWLVDPAAGFEVLALDRPGFGASGPVHAVTRLAAQAEALGTLLTDDGRPNVLLGHSLGGAVAACLAALRPGRVDALVLLAASLDPALERVHPLQRLGAWPLLARLLPRAMRNANAELLALRDELEALAPQLARIRCPVFIVHGTHDDLVPVANVRFLQERLTGAAEVVTRLLPGGNHFLPWNAAAEVRRIVAAAAARVC